MYIYVFSPSSYSSCCSCCYCSCYCCRFCCSCACSCLLVGETVTLGQSLLGRGWEAHSLLPRLRPAGAAIANSSHSRPCSSHAPMQSGPGETCSSATVPCNKHRRLQLHLRTSHSCLWIWGSDSDGPLLLYFAGRFHGRFHAQSSYQKGVPEFCHQTSFHHYHHSKGLEQPGMTPPFRQPFRKCPSVSIFATSFAPNLLEA